MNKGGHAPCNCKGMRLLRWRSGKRLRRGWTHSERGSSSMIDLDAEAHLWPRDVLYCPQPQCNSKPSDRTGPSLGLPKLLQVEELWLAYLASHSVCQKACITLHLISVCGCAVLRSISTGVFRKLRTNTYIRGQQNSTHTNFFFTFIQVSLAEHDTLIFAFTHL